MNPKKMQRDVKRQMQNIGIGTKSQQALKLQQEQNKQIIIPIDNLSVRGESDAKRKRSSRT